MKKFGWIVGVLLAVLGVAGVTYASAIKSWSTGEVISSSDLNTNFSHLHATMVGGHGARLVNADVSSSAAIAHSKLATPALLPKAWSNVASTCAATPCTQAAGTGFGSVTRTSQGIYVATPSVTPVDGAYAATVTALHATLKIYCYVVTQSSSITFHCVDEGGTLQDTGFNILFLDN